MNFKNILLSCVLIFGSLSLSGCYTQLSMFHPEVETDSEEFQLYSVARVRPNISLHAQDGAGQSLGMAYQMMYNRFQPFFGFSNRYDYYNPYYYGGYYRDYNTYNLGGYTMRIPYTDLYSSGKRKPRTFSTSRGDNGSSGTNLNITRSNHVGYNGKNNNNSYGNSSNISSTRSSSGGSSSSSSSSSSGGRRVTRRN